MNLLKEYRKKEELKKKIFLELEQSNLPYNTLLEMLEELTNLYKN